MRAEVAVRKAILSRELIVRAALDLIDEGGVEGLTMRALGRSLGVQAMSLYRYVPSRDALLDGVQEAVVREIRPQQPTGSWQGDVSALARELRRVLARHPRAIALFARPAATEETFEAVEHAVEVLQDAGFGFDDALRGFQLVLAYVVGQALWQFAPEGERSVDDEFAFGLEVLIAGLEARLR